MKITSLGIENFRNISQINIDLSPRINIFHGHNGSGKTSLLETIHYLGLGRSFRTRNIRRLINQSADKFVIISQLSRPNLSTLTVGIERQLEQSVIKIGGKPEASLVELATILPLQLINADSHLLLTSGPLARRQFLDWGAFHVEPQFIQYWQKANRIIKQRNANLKSAQKYSDISYWDEELEICANWLNEQRQAQLQRLEPTCLEMLSELLNRSDLKLHYYPGWNTENSLKDALKNSFSKEQQLGYTQYGPHRADLQLKIKNVAAVEVMSQGQQKLSAYALRLAQGLSIQGPANKSCIFLIDDLPSELDKDRKQRIIDIILNQQSQFFVTGIEHDSLTELAQAGASKVFHVEHGKII
jgi:DNA replication and repair protein RecF